MIGASGIGSEIGNIRAVHVVGAQDARVDLEGEALIGFLDRGFDAQAEVERRQPFGIESPAVDGGAFSRYWFERPPGIVRAVARPLKPQAKPPMAM